MEKDIEISFERGTVNNGVLIETEVCLILPKKERKLKPSRTIRERRTNRGKDYYIISAGERYRIKTARLKRGRGDIGWAILVVKENGEIINEDWGGKFCPQFSISK